MPEPRDSRITTNIETTFFVLAQRVAEQNGWTLAQYIRKLIADDLNKRKLLSQELLMRMTTTDSMQDVQKLAAKAS